ncbi:MAG: CDP-alcohol phosphatidyltransferase family protein [Pseudomonadota bacterium]
MFDRRLRPWLDPPLARAAELADAVGWSANGVTLAGFAIGLAAVPALAAQAYGLALLLILLNRIADGLDGALARRQGPTDLGGFLDIVLDFLLYAAVPVGFALADPANAVPATVLIFAFVGTGSSFLAFAAVAARRGIAGGAHPDKALFYLGGLTEGAETILFFVLICLFPAAFPTLAWIFAGLCGLTTLFRILAGCQTLRRRG